MTKPYSMSSKERLLRAIDRQPVDHVPLLLRFWSMGGPENNIPFCWENQVSRVENTLQRGLDDTLLLEPPLGYVENYIPEYLPGVHSHVNRSAPIEDDGYPRLNKVYETPEGPLQTTIKITEDWPHGDDIHLFDDYNIPRLVEPLVKVAEDLPRVKHLFGEPSLEQLDYFRQQARDLRQHTKRLGVALDGGWTALGDAAMWLCGMQRILYGQMDEPDFIERLLDTILEWELRRMDLVIDEGADVIVHSAWYEGTDFWTPRSFQRMLKPRLAQMVAKAHANGVRFRYIITKGWKPLRKDLLEIGVDCITGVDPVQDRVDLAEVKSAIGGQVCLMGGVNSAILFSVYEEADIRQAVNEAIRLMAPGSGFILFPVDAVFNNQNWNKVQAMIDAWKALI